MTPPQHSDLARVERLQASLLQLLIGTIMVVLGLIVAISYQRRLGSAIPILAVVALLACLYAMTRERSLRRKHAEVVRSLIAHERQLDRMGEAIREGQSELGLMRQEADKLGHRLDEITRLYRAISMVNSVPDPSTTYDAVVRAALELVHADRGSLMLVEDSLGALVIRSQQGLSPQVAEQARVTLGEGVAGWVAENDEAVLLQGRASSDGRFSATGNSPVRSALSVPMRAHGRVTGVLNIGHEQGSDKAALDEGDKSLAQIFAQHAAIAVEHARLWERLATRNR
ncbi:MAG TPA: GAF domain-containing protein [Thermoanaerobaculia bacterium]|nr:GAF domain-containing protein [Thermoanaerobaculia bacterium]